MVHFARRRKLDGWRDLKFRGTAIRPTEQVKHLGVILDAKLNWGLHMQRVRSRACAPMGRTKGLQRNLGLKPQGDTLGIYGGCQTSCITRSYSMVEQNQAENSQGHAH